MLSLKSQFSKIKIHAHSTELKSRVCNMVSFNSRWYGWTFTEYQRILLIDAGDAWSNEWIHVGIR